MLKLIIVGTIATLSLAREHPINADMVAEIKKSATTWRPYEVRENPHAHLTHDEIQGMLKTYTTYWEKPEFLRFEDDTEPVNAPTAFDSRTQWPNCIHAIRDQKQCGSCWAFGATEAFSDRLCIATNGATNVILSPQDLVSCDTGNMGCDGGYLNRAWSYLQKTGAVSEDCYPYTSGDGSEPACRKTCTNGAFQFTKYTCKNIIEKKTVATIKDEIYRAGPLETGFNVYGDFMSYKSGIYTHISGALEGGHAVKVLGWGVENGTNYWICANSWGPAWGEKGFFRIKVGQCGIDSDLFGCDPK
jgi:cathepsin B